jgi:hypothetical protein
MTHGMGIQRRYVTWPDAPWPHHRKAGAVVDTNSTIQIAVGLFGGGSLVAAIRAFYDRKKTLADAESITIKTANSLMEGMRKDIESLRLRIISLEMQVSHRDIAIEAYRRRNDYLSDLLRLNSIPVQDWHEPMI